MAAHLGHYKHESMFNPDGDTRNSKSSKPLKGDFSELHIEVPRDRQGTLEPQLIAVVAWVRCSRALGVRHGAW